MERCNWIASDDGGSCVVTDPAFKGAFDIYDARTQLQDSKCFELSSYDTSEQSWVIQCSPVGLGVDHQIFVSTNGREMVSDTRWSFSKPYITSSTPRPYNANGEDIVIRGLNLGGVKSPTQVMVGGVNCANAVWMPSYDADGLPYITCRTQRDVVGAKAVAMQVALQIATSVKAFPKVLNVTKQLSRFHSVCKNGESNPETGEERTFYGSPGELCKCCVF